MKKIKEMRKSIIITYNEADESLLMALFQKFKIKTKTVQPESEIETIRQRLHDKFVVSGEWANMTDEEREDATHAETMIYGQEQADHHTYTAVESQDYRSKLREKLTSHAKH